MPIQTAYTNAHLPAYEGQMADLALSNPISKVAEGSDINFGRAVVRGTADKQAVLPSSTGQAFVGITVQIRLNVDDERVPINI